MMNRSGSNSGIRHLVCAALVMLAGCATDEQDLGALEVPLSAPGPDGSTYYLNAGLSISGQGFSDAVDLGGEQTVKRVNLPPGSYTAHLLTGMLDPTTVQLVRRDADGSTSLVNGAPTTTFPIEFTIVRGEVTAITLSFAIGRANNVTFGRGHLDVSVAFEEVPASGTQVDLFGTMEQVSLGDPQGDPNAPSALDPNLPSELAAQLPTNESSLYVGLGVTLTGPWELRSTNRACAPAELASWGSSYSGISDSFAEYASDDAPELVCLTATLWSTQLEIELSHVGPASTASFQLIPVTNLFLATTITVVLPPEVFDGETIDVEALVTRQQAPVGINLLIGRIAGPAFYQASMYGGSVDFWLTPLL